MNIRKHWTASAGRQLAAPRRRARLWRGCVERLEDRLLLSAGDLDLSFDGDGYVITDVEQLVNSLADVALYPQVGTANDGKIVAVGTVVPPGTYQNADMTLIRYNPDGSLDSAFGIGGIARAEVGTGANASNYGIRLAIQPDGKVLAGGRVDQPRGWDFALLRFNADGTLDTSFGGKKGSPLVVTDFGLSQVLGVAIQPDGRIVAGGETGNNGIAIARYLSDGSLDRSFDGDGKVLTYFDVVPGYVAIAGDVYEMTTTPDNKMVFAGHIAKDQAGNVRNFYVARFNIDGTLDTTFGGDGFAIVDSIVDDAWTDAGVDVQADGKIVAAWTHAYRNASNDIERDLIVVRYNVDGTPDVTFGVGGMVIIPMGLSLSNASALSVHPNGKILISGSTQGRAFVAQLDPDGSIDSQFGASGFVNLLGIMRSSSGIAVQPDGNIVVSGHDWAPETLDDFSVVRLVGDPPPVEISISDVTVAEGDSGSVPATLRVSLNRPSATSVSVDFTTADGTAVAGSDYVAQAGTLSFFPGETLKTIVVDVLGDTAKEQDEFFQVTLSGAAGADIADQEGVVLIQDNDKRGKPNAASNTTVLQTDPATIVTPTTIDAGAGDDGVAIQEQDSLSSGAGDALALPAQQTPRVTQNGYSSPSTVDDALAQLADAMLGGILADDLLAEPALYGGGISYPSGGPHKQRGS